MLIYIYANALINQNSVKLKLAELVSVIIEKAVYIPNLSLFKNVSKFYYELNNDYFSSGSFVYRYTGPI